MRLHGEHGQCEAMRVVDGGRWSGKEIRCTNRATHIDDVGNVYLCALCAPDFEDARPLDAGPPKT